MRDLKIRPRFGILSVLVAMSLVAIASDVARRHRDYLIRQQKFIKVLSQFGGSVQYEEEPRLLDPLARLVMPTMELRNITYVAVDGVPVDEAFIAEMLSVTTLEQVILNDCGLTPDALRRILALPRLIRLDVSNNQSLGDIGLAIISTHPRIQRLAFKDSGGTKAGVLLLAPARSLRSLDIRGISVDSSTLRALASVRFERLLCTVECSDSDSAPISIVNWSHLQSLCVEAPQGCHLTVEDCPKLSDFVIAEGLERLSLVRLPQLSELAIDFGSIDELQLCEMTGLQRLTAAGSKLRHLGSDRLPGLTLADLSDTAVTPIAVNGLVANAPRLETLLLRNTNMSDGLCDILVSSTLAEVILDKSAVPIECIARLCMVPTIRKISIVECGIDDHAIDDLRRRFATVEIVH